MLLFVISDVGFEIPDRFVVGYALDYNEYFRDLNVSQCLKHRTLNDFFFKLNIVELHLIRHLNCCFWSSFL